MEEPGKRNRPIAPNKLKKLIIFLILIKIAPVMDIQKNKKKGREAMDILLGDVKQGLAKITLFIVLNTW